MLGINLITLRRNAVYIPCLLSTLLIPLVSIINVEIFVCRFVRGLIARERLKDLDEVLQADKSRLGNGRKILFIPLVSAVNE